MVTDLLHSIGECEETLRYLVDEHASAEEFWPEFAAAANVAEERLLHADRPMFHQAIVEMLRQYGKLPSLAASSFHQRRNAV
jgi:hypothetical protein